MAQNKTPKTSSDSPKPVAPQMKTVQVEVPKDMRKSHISALLNADLAEPVHGFVEFFRERAVVGLAVGYVVAIQSQGIIKQLIASFLDPLSKLIFGGTLSAQTATWRYHGRSADFSWGLFVYTVIDFLVIMVAIYAVVKIFKLDKLDKPKK